MKLNAAVRLLAKARKWLDEMMAEVAEVDSDLAASLSKLNNQCVDVDRGLGLKVLQCFSGYTINNRGPLFYVIESSTDSNNGLMLDFRSGCKIYVYSSSKEL